MNKINVITWILLDILVFSFAILLLLLGGMENNNSCFGAAFFITVGIFFLTSRIMKEKLYFSKGLYWVAVNVFKPKTRYNHIICGAILIFGGLATALSQPLGGSEKNFYEHLKEEPQFWISILLVLLFNAFVGVYTAKRKKRQ